MKEIVVLVIGNKGNSLTLCTVTSINTNWLASSFLISVCVVLVYHVMFVLVWVLSCCARVVGQSVRHGSYDSKLLEQTNKN